MLWVYGHYKYFNLFSMGDSPESDVYGRQNRTSKDLLLLIYKLILSRFVWNFTSTIFQRSVNSYIYYANVIQYTL